MIYNKPSVLCIVIIITLLFGLWPFNFHSENQVHFLKDQDGIQFHKRSMRKSSKRGIVFSPQQVDDPLQSSVYSPVTIEIYLESIKEPPHGLGYILSFYDGKTQEPLIIAQWLSHLVIRSRINEANTNKYREIGQRNVFKQNTKILITIVSGKETTEIYTNGKLSQLFSRDSFINRTNITGQLVLGNSSTGTDPWIGNVYGISIYEKLLTPEQVKQSCEKWSQSRTSTLEPKNNPFIMYTFKKPDDFQIRNMAGDKNHLIVPTVFTPLKREILLPFWKDFEFSRMLVSDVIINLLGFIPFGFCFALYFMKNKRMCRSSAYIVTVLSGALLSLIIESTQVYLPTRHSSSLDLLCNTAGIILGTVVIMVFRMGKDDSGSRLDS